VVFRDVISRRQLLQKCSHANHLQCSHRFSLPSYAYVNFRPLNVVAMLLAITLEFLANVNLCSRTLYAVARPSVCNARALYSGGCKFQQFFYGIWYFGHRLTCTKIFTEIEIVPGEPFRRGGGLNPRGVAKYSDFLTYRRLYLGNDARYEVSYY